MYSRESAFSVYSTTIRARSFLQSSYLLN